MSMTLTEDKIGPMMDLGDKASGTSFVLAMEHEGKVTLYPRNNQPCQGGETRKYYRTHGDACTQPENSKPSDLHHPFPKGRPVGILFPSCTLGHSPRKDPYLDWLIKDTQSPVRCVMGGVIYDKGHILFADTRLDPTVMIFAIQMMRRGVPESGGNHLLAAVRQMGSYEYYFNPKISIRRFVDGHPRDLSGGTYYDGFDYNRSFNANIFTDKVGKFVCSASVTEQMIQDAYEAEEPYVDEPYQFTTYAGKKYASHLEWIKENKR